MTPSSIFVLVVVLVIFILPVISIEFSIYKKKWAFLNRFRWKKIGEPFGSESRILINPTEFTAVFYLIGKSKKITSTAGELNNMVYSNRTYIRHVKKAIKKHDLDYSIVFGPNLHIENIRLFHLAMRYPNNIKLYRIEERTPQHFKHFYLNDDSEALQIDVPHGEDAPDSEREGQIIFQNDSEFEREKEEVDRWYDENTSNSKPVDISSPERVFDQENSNYFKTYDPRVGKSNSSKGYEITRLWFYLLLRKIPLDIIDSISRSRRKDNPGTA